MKLSEILKDWPKHEKEFYQNPIIRSSQITCNATLTACDREIDREALAKILMDIQYSGHQKWEYLHEDQRNQFEFEAAEIISTMPTWLRKVSER